MPIIQNLKSKIQNSTRRSNQVTILWENQLALRFTPQPLAGTEKVLPAQLVLLAMGFLGLRDCNVFDEAAAN
jgi:NADPH-dependent glutamate synthase beta subunit-like oxidoreductase